MFWRNLFTRFFAALMIQMSVVGLAVNATEQPKLKLGIYATKVSQQTEAPDGTTVSDELSLQIIISSVDESGGIKGRIILHNQQGEVTGSISPEGMVRLEGTLTHKVLPGEWKFILTAFLRENALTDGKYTKVGPRLRSSGRFNHAPLENSNPKSKPS